MCFILTAPAENELTRAECGSISDDKNNLEEMDAVRRDHKEVSTSFVSHSELTASSNNSPACVSSVSSLSDSFEVITNEHDDSPALTVASGRSGNFDCKQTLYSHSDVKNIPTDQPNEADETNDVKLVKQTGDVMELNAAEDFDDQLSRTIQIENVREDLVDVTELYVEHRKHGGGELEKSPEYDSKRQKLTVIFTDAKGNIT